MNRNDILTINDNQVLAVTVPEWAGTVHVRSWSGTERAALLSWHKSHEQDPGFAAEFLAVVACMSLCDEHGARHFADDETDLLQQRNASAVDRIAKAALQHNGMSPGAVDEAKKN